MFLKPLQSSGQAALVLRNVRTGADLATSLEPAFTSEARRKGLLGRDRLEDGHALVIAPCFSIHTFFMRFPIDVVFVARDGRVVKVSPATPPWRLRFGFRAFATVELPAGTVERTGTRRGDRLVIVPAGEPVPASAP